MDDFIQFAIVDHQVASVTFGLFFNIESIDDCVDIIHMVQLDAAYWYAKYFTQQLSILASSCAFVM